MRIRILGTSAAEGIPALGCDCRVCGTARQRGGKEIRSRSGVLIDSSLKLDFGPDTLYHIHRDRLNPTEWRWLFFTHSHHDHVAEHELQYLMPGFAPESMSKNLRLFGNAHIKAKVESVRNYLDLGFTVQLIEPEQAVTADGYSITPIRARHTAGDGETCLNLIVETNGASFLYACDTGFYPDETMEFLAGRQIRAVAMDCTAALVHSEYDGHLSVAQLLEQRNRLLDCGAIAQDARFVATHFSHNGGALYDELEAALNPHGVEVAFDGMTFDV